MLHTYMLHTCIHTYTYIHTYVRTSEKPRAPHRTNKDEGDRTREPELEHRLSLGQGARRAPRQRVSGPTCERGSG